MLKKLALKYSFDLSIFTNNVLIYLISMFTFSRLFYVIANWNDLKYMSSFSDFFATIDYNFSLFGLIFGFVLVFVINLKLRGEKAIKYIDALVLSFLISLSFGYIGALLGGQVYGKSTNYGIEIIYTNSFSPIASTPVFPLPIVYAFLFFLLFAILYTLRMYIKIKGFIAYIGLILFSLIILVFENFSGKTDMFKNLIYINFNQVLALIFIVFSFYRLYVLSKIGAKDTTIILDNK